MKSIRTTFISIVIFLGLTSCQTTGSVELSLLDEIGKLGLTDEQVDTLLSLEQVDEFPLYIMHYYVPYETVSVDDYWQYVEMPIFDDTWGCSLFSAFADPENMLFGRNFDWEYSPALMLFTDPPDGYASVSTVDIKYLGYWNEEAHGIAELPLGGRLSLLDAPFLPFDGMNETGLAVGMAAVPAGNMLVDPGKETVDSLLVTHVTHPTCA